jgi:hypothetical protein
MAPAAATASPAGRLAESVRQARAAHFVKDSLLPFPFATLLRGGMGKQGLRRINLPETRPSFSLPSFSRRARQFPPGRAR